MKRTFSADVCQDFDQSSHLEWLLTNGIGGYASGTISGANTRRYHGHLVAATKPPTERTVLLANLEATVEIGNESIGISTNEHDGAIYPQGYKVMDLCEVGHAYVRWHFVFGNGAVSKTIALVPGRNEAVVFYRNEGATPLTLRIRPLVCHKFYHANFNVQEYYPDSLLFEPNATFISHGGTVLNIFHRDAVRTASTGWYYRFKHQREAERGLNPNDDYFCPCELEYRLKPDETCSLFMTTEAQPSYDFRLLPEYEATDVREGLVEASRKFLVKTPERTTILAGYPWLTDWGRDTMISIPGICLETERVSAAKDILKGYAARLSQGLIPNRFAGKGETIEYNTADATLWFGNAIYLTLQKSWDVAFARKAHKWLGEIIDWHIKGTHSGIRLDQEDGLLVQGDESQPLTWMNAKTAERIVTPRRGKAIEVNGLWANLLRVMEWLSINLDHDPESFRKLAEQTEASIKGKFWQEDLGYYFDTIEPYDASFRPNQLIAMALPFTPLRDECARTAIDEVERHLLTPFGLRTLNEGNPDFNAEFHGAPLARQLAYHQGTAWPWLLGQYVSAVLNITGDVVRAEQAISQVMTALDEYGVHGIAELYAGVENQYPAGSPFQAWSMAEILRAIGHIEQYKAQLVRTQLVENPT